MSTSNGNDSALHHDPGPSVHAGGVGLDGGLSGNATDVINQLSAVSKNGIIVNALLVWIDVQMRGTPENCWMIEAQTRFTDKQITEARTLLWNIAKVNYEKIGEVKGYMDTGGNIHGRKGERKASESLSDINKLRGQTSGLIALS